ncbi:multicopper oxidase [Couchioplanes caeruleus]|uniref:Multicopper oxidase n=1 Tax=Couchioplanes caeruleus TaxID=56438 RepID=A0A3N1GIG1_9ACTN|nr:multicopper oxidase [Couchioplanes caeruleus]
MIAVWPAGGAFSGVGHPTDIRSVGVAILPLAVTIVLASRGAGTRVVGTRVAGQVAAVGMLVSAYLAWVPQDPADRPLVAAFSLVVLAATAAVAVARLRLQAADSRAARLPWLATLTTLALIAAIFGLYVQNQAPAQAAGHAHHRSSLESSAAGRPSIAVASLTGLHQGKPDVRFTLVAAHGKIRLSSGAQIDALTFNGASPGPTLRVRQGQLVEVTLVNTDVAEGVTVHWHGVDVPNAEDGVPGLTQEAVRPGGRHVYRFVPNPAPATRTYDLVMDNGSAFTNGTFSWANTVNGASGAAIATLMVDRGDTVRMRFTNRGIIDHPMHLHGHRIRVLSRNDAPVTGSPWWTHTLNVAPGESFEITFTADNPGIWMDHCHNFEHAAEGMLWHLAYTGVIGPSPARHDAE